MGGDVLLPFDLLEISLSSASYEKVGSSVWLNLSRGHRYATLFLDPEFVSGYPTDLVVEVQMQSRLSLHWGGHLGDEWTHVGVLPASAIVASRAAVFSLSQMPWWGAHGRLRFRLRCASATCQYRLRSYLELR